MKAKPVWMKLYNNPKTGWYSLGVPRDSEAALSSETTPNEDFKWVCDVEILNRDGTLMIAIGKQA